LSIYDFFILGLVLCDIEFMTRISPETPYTIGAKIMLTASMALSACKPASVADTELPCNMQKAEYVDKVIRFHFSGNCNGLKVIARGPGWMGRKIIDKFDTNKFNLDVASQGPIVGTPTSRVEFWMGETLVGKWDRIEEKTG
jgi:hypothetical protein